MARRRGHRLDPRGVHRRAQCFVGGVTYFVLVSLACVLSCLYWGEMFENKDSWSRYDMKEESKEDVTETVDDGVGGRPLQ